MTRRIIVQEMSPGREALVIVAARVLRYAGYACFAWILLPPHPAAAAVIVLIAPLAWLTGVSSNGLVGLESGPDGPQGGVFAALFGPAFALGMMALESGVRFDPSWLEWAPLPVGGVFGAALLGVGFRRSDSGRGVASPWAGGLLAGAFYGLGVFTLGDAWLDPGPPTAYPVIITAMRAESGKYPRHFLGVTAWGPRRQAGEIDVPAAVYRRVRTGETVCVVMHPGAFAVPWHDVERCPVGMGVSPPPPSPSGAGPGTR